MKKKKNIAPKGAKKNPKSGKRPESQVKNQMIRDLVFSITDLLEKDPKQTFTLLDLQKGFNLTSRREKVLLLDALTHLLKTNLVISNDFNNSFRYNDEFDQVTGVVDFVNPNFAYVLLENTAPQVSDIKVYKENLLTALDGDVVKLRLFKRRGRMEGHVTEVVERKRNTFVGKVEMSEKFAFIIADNRRMHVDIFVRKDDLQNAQKNDKVIVEITDWGTQRNNPSGKVIEVLGQAGLNETEMHAIMAEFDLPYHFPESVINKSSQIEAGITEEEIAKRKDFRDKTTFTIDPLTAQDFDDALSIVEIGKDLWEIGVHIADVSHYVEPQTVVDKEAYRRATSVYLVDRCVPMLPERLSNQLCSLVPNKDRLTFSAVFHIDAHGVVHQQWFGRTVIHSDRRFTYEEAQERLESGEGDFAAEIITLNKIAKQLQAKRFQEGAIAFESTEVVFQLDAQGKPLAVVPKERKDAHKLIEEFMLLANKKVATFVYEKRKGKQEATMVYRTHDRPDTEKLERLLEFAVRFGHQIQMREDQIPQMLNDLSQKVLGKPEQNLIEGLAIRAMAKAIYTTEPLKHFGLGFDHYSHFTSPIRRYPDLMVHRLLAQYLEGDFVDNKDDYEKKCVHSSKREKMAAEAERASIKYKQVEFMQDHLGEEMEGMVSGVTEWGLYVEVTQTKCEGMVRIADMKDDFYEFDPKNIRIVGTKNKNIYTLGDIVLVKVLNTNLDKRSIDLEMVKKIQSLH